MREVFVNSDHARVGLYQSVLEEAGIPTLMRNENSHNTMQGATWLFYPALCVVNDADYDEAMRILGEVHYAQPSEAADWKCTKCGEEVPGSFDACWQCGELRTGASGAAGAVD